MIGLVGTLGIMALGTKHLLQCEYFIKRLDIYVPSRPKVGTFEIINGVVKDVKENSDVLPGADHRKKDSGFLSVLSEVLIKKGQLDLMHPNLAREENSDLMPLPQEHIFRSRGYNYSLTFDELGKVGYYGDLDRSKYLNETVLQYEIVRQLPGKVKFDGYFLSSEDVEKIYFPTKPRIPKEELDKLINKEVDKMTNGGLNGLSKQELYKMKEGARIKILDAAHKRLYDQVSKSWGKRTFGGSRLMCSLDESNCNQKLEHLKRPTSKNMQEHKAILKRLAEPPLDWQGWFTEKELKKNHAPLILGSKDLHKRKKPLTFKEKSVLDMDPYTLKLYGFRKLGRHGYFMNMSRKRLFTAFSRQEKDAMAKIAKHIHRYYGKSLRIPENGIVPLSIIKESAQILGFENLSEKKSYYHDKKGKLRNDNAFQEKTYKRFNSSVF